MYDPVNRPPDEGPPGEPKLTERQTKQRDRRNCNALLERIKNERSGLLWWQNTPTSFSFSDSVVQDRLLKLMKSEIVLLMSSMYMSALCQRLIEANWELVHNRIDARSKWEIEREKQLVFDGKLPIADGPPGIANHPFFHEDNLVRKRLQDDEAKRAQRSLKKPKAPVVPLYEYPTLSESAVVVRREEDATLESDNVEVDRDECAERAHLQLGIGKEVYEKIIRPPEYYDAHYEALGVTQIKLALTVDKMPKFSHQFVHYEKGSEATFSTNRATFHNEWPRYGSVWKPYKIKNLSSFVLMTFCVTTYLVTFHSDIALGQKDPFLVFHGVSTALVPAIFRCSLRSGEMKHTALLADVWLVSVIFTNLFAAGIILYFQMTEWQNEYLNRIDPKVTIALIFGSTLVSLAELVFVVVKTVLYITSEFQSFIESL